MRIAFVSDIHGNLPALEAVAADIKRRGADIVVNLGDSLSGPLLPLETAQFLMASDWLHLAGNHERQILELHAGSGMADTFAHSQLTSRELTWIASLLPAKQITSEVLACHGTPTSDVTCLLQNADLAATQEEIESRLGDVAATLIACGHSHVARSVRSTRGQLIVNPGSIGQPAYMDDYPYPHTIASGSPDARYAIVEQHQGQWQSSLLAVPYNNRDMAALAKSRGRLDWEAALLTGYICQAVSG
ncbi:metallophosphoesterase [Duganella sp. FT80W]|uniref:Metallophosphoesterase n=1 Tax=Duganella guangzhouensis TaxID=2666084 RepID=A0A6I2L7B2_9BURK|nr:metallophosphoesterase family protein [Duganella guangzhouensis]MRW92566.1 metallophosphoesterase [Duganella guangzhouensis]